MKKFFSITRGMCVTLLCVVATHAQTPGTPSVPVSPDTAEMADLKRRLRDWAQLERYGEANKQLVAAPSAEGRVVFIGDSITDRWDDAGYGGFFPGKPYVNRGIGGQVTAQMLVRFFPDVVALRPRAVVILAGTNDVQRDPTAATTARIKDNIMAMAELARARNIQVVVASLLPVHDNGHDREGKPIKRTDRRPPAQLREINLWMKEYVAGHNHTYLDYYSALVTNKGLMREELSEDGLHVNAKGYALMLPLAEAAIAKALSKSKSAN